MTAVKGIIFDKDGTLFDFSKTWESWAVALLQRIATDDAHAVTLGQAIGFDIHAGRFAPDSPAIAGTPIEIANALTPALPTGQSDEILSYINEEAQNAPQIEVVPLVPFVNALKRDGYLLGVVTNDAQTPTLAHLDTAGITAHFDFVAGSDSGWGAKPAPGQLLACARTMQCETCDLVMVGDSTHDLIAAERAGMRGVGVLTGMAEAEVLAPYAAAVLPDIGHLPAWLKTQSGP